MATKLRGSVGLIPAESRAAEAPTHSQGLTFPGEVVLPPPIRGGEEEKREEEKKKRDDRALNEALKYELGPDAV